ncbi:MAG: nitroreductase/quinone reductase family protein [Acidimicrobiia bacterium]|nr:nitroreductase/quinone reductase family protein [Acidimicrobiia bacterium]
MHPIEAEALDSPSEYVSRQAQQYVASNGADIEHPVADRVFLLYFKGRKSGQIRRVPLVCVEDGDDLIIVASKGGADHHPTWYLNIDADPNVWVRNKADFYEARATTLEGPERAAAWAKMVKAMPFFGEYEQKTDRVMPVVRLARQARSVG